MGFLFHGFDRSIYLRVTIEGIYLRVTIEGLEVKFTPSGFGSCTSWFVNLGSSPEKAHAVLAVLKNPIT